MSKHHSEHHLPSPLPSAADEAALNVSGAEVIARVTGALKFDHERTSTAKDWEVKEQDEAAPASWWQDSMAPSSSVSEMLYKLDALTGDKSMLPCERRSEAGGFLETFVYRPEEKHVCPICHLPLRQPVQTKCGHHLCRSCMMQILRRPNPCCPLDRIPLTEIFPDNFCRREVLKLLVKCNNHEQNCPWQGELRELEDHLTNCEMQLVTCSNQECSARFPRRKMNKHMDTCPYRLESCEFCGEKIAIVNMKVHCRDDCANMLKECPQLCGSFVQRKELVRHVNTQCPETIVDCHFHICGCRFKGRRLIVDEHCTQSEELHLELLSAALREQDSAKLVLQNKVYQNQAKIDSLTAILTQQEQQAGTCRQREDAEIKKLREQVDSLLRGNLVNIGHESHHSVALLQPRTAALEQNIVTINRQLAEVQSQQAKIIEESAYIRGMLDDHDLRLLAAETATFDGCLLWKLPNFDKLTADARNGVKVSHYSPPFYTSRHGYKVCGRIYPYGDGSGRASHLSLFFVVMQGDHDALLSWPFRQRVTLVVLDQSPSAHHLQETFLPDPQSSSYQRPTTGMNIASGCPRMVSLDALFSSRYGYTKSNTLFVKIKVDTTGLEAI